MVSCAEILQVSLIFLKRKKKSIQISGKAVNTHSLDSAECNAARQSHPVSRRRPRPNSANRRGAATAAEPRAAGVARSGLEPGRRSRRDSDERSLQPIGSQIAFPSSNRSGSSARGAETLGQWILIPPGGSQGGVEAPPERRGSGSGRREDRKPRPGPILTFAFPPGAGSREAG